MDTPLAKYLANERLNDTINVDTEKRPKHMVRGELDAYLVVILLFATYVSTVTRKHGQLDIRWELALGSGKVSQQCNEGTVLVLLR